MTALFQHRHYVEIARIISTFPFESDRRLIASAFSEALVGSNPNYDQARFYEAAMGKPKPRDRSE